MNRAIHERLTRAARDQDLIFYEDIAPLADLDLELQRDRTELGRLLGDISTYEHEHGKPLLSAVVVFKDESHRMPGSGFFKLRSVLGLRPRQDDMAFWATELQRVYAVWARSEESM